MAEIAQSPNPTSTREKILDASESLFIELGFTATSMRAIASRAGVNLAATNYHFGSKTSLFSATIHRRIQPINEERCLLLDRLKSSGRSLTAREIIEAFLRPVENAARAGLQPALVGRMFHEPESLIRPILEQEFGEIAFNFQVALAGVLKNIPQETLSWRFHFLIGSMVHLLQFQAPLGTESTLGKFTEGIEHLIDYSVAGLEQSNNRQAYD